MTKPVLFTFLLLFLVGCRSDQKQSVPDEAWTSLWNGKNLNGWHTYLGTPYNRETDSLGKKIVPYGIDHDPLGVITVVATEAGNAIRISGLAWGMIYSEKEFKNYHLKLKVKWGQAMYPPREKGPRDSGLLYHGFGEPGSANNWMGSQELQVQEGDMGDYWPVGDVEIDVPSVAKDDKYFIYKQGAPLRTYYLAEILKTASDDSLAKRRVFKAFDAERPHGEWNELELISYGDSSVHIVNGKEVMRLYNSRNMRTKAPLNSGRIILQSEGAEVFYKDLYLKPIDRMPEQYQ
jgi:hypothetical protein